MSSGTAQETPPRPEEEADLGPSRLSEDEISLPRILGLIGMGLALLGAFLMFLSMAMGNPVRVAYLALIGVGLALMLYHSARDAEPGVSRAYGLFGAVLLFMGGLFAVLPGGQGEARELGYRFLSMGLPSLGLGLLFLLSYLRFEPDRTYRDYAHWLLLGLGVVFSAVIFLVGVINPPFMVGTGLLLVLLGLAFLCAFIAQVGAAGGLGYQAALGVGVLGLLAVLYGVTRSVIPALAGGQPYFVPVGLIMIGAGLVYVCVSIGLLSDLQAVLVLRRELTAYFYSPIFYIVLFGMSVLGWMNYWFFLRQLQLITEDRGAVTEPILQNYFFALIPVLAMLGSIPAITMRLFAEERRTGTLEVMMTAAVSEWSVVMGKFLAGLVVFLAVWLPWGLFPISLTSATGVGFDYRPLLTFFIALTAVGASFVAMGLFFSSLTQNQIVAAMLSFLGVGVFLGFYLASLYLEDSLWQPLFERLGFLSLWREALSGRLLVRDLLLHLSIAFFWIFATIKVLEARKWS